MEQLCLSIHQLLTQLNDTFTQNYQPIKDMTSPESNPLRIQYSQQLLVLISAVSDILTKANKVRDEHKEKAVQLVVCVQDLKKTIVYQQEEISRLKREKVAAQKVLVDNSAQTEPDVRQIEREQRLRSQLQRLREFAEQKHYENKRLRAELTQNVLLLKAQEALLEAEKEERSFEGRTSDDFSLASSLEGIAIPKKTSQPAARYSRQEETPRHRYREEEEAEEPAEEERTSQHEPREFPREDIPDDPRPHPPPHPPHPPHLHPHLHPHPHPHPPRDYGSESNPDHPDPASEPSDGREDQSSEQAPPAGDKEDEEEEENEDEEEEEGGDGGSEQLRLDGSSESLGDLDFFQRIYDEDFRARHPLHPLHPEEV